MSTIDERCYGHQPALGQLLLLRDEFKRLSVANELQAIEIDRLNKARLKDARDYEDAARILISMLVKRGKASKRQLIRANTWKQTAKILGFKIKVLESKIRHDDRTFAKFVNKI